MNEQLVIKALKSRESETFYGETQDGQAQWVTYADVLALIGEKNADIKMLTEHTQALGGALLRKDAEIEKLEDKIHFLRFASD